METLEKAAIRALTHLYTLEAIYTYRDENGAEIYYRARGVNNQEEKTIRPLYQDEAGKFQIGEAPSIKNAKPLYNLHLLAKHKEAIVWIVEGEKCADALNAFFEAQSLHEAHVAITSGSSTSAKGADWAALAGRQCILWPDNDVAGKKYAKDTAIILDKLNCELSMVDIKLLALPEAGDVVDWLADVKNNAQEAFYSLPINYYHPLSEQLSMRCMADIVPLEINWMWPDRIALGKITVLAGQPGLGKSQLTASLAAHVTTGTVWPDKALPCKKGSVIFLSAEDDAADTMVPRLHAAGADLGKCHILDGVLDENGNERCISLDANIMQIEAAIRQHRDIRLVVIDPVSAYLGDTKSHDNASMRGLLLPLSKMAQDYQFACVLITHLNKSQGQDAMGRVIGSIGLIAAARCCYLVQRDKSEDQKRLFVPIKNNNGNDRTGLAFTIESKTILGGIKTSFIIWKEGEVKETADDLLNGVPEAKASNSYALEEAIEFIQEVMEPDVPYHAGKLKAEAKEAGISFSAIDRARKKLKITPKREKKKAGKVMWIMPPEVDISDYTESIQE